MIEILTDSTSDLNTPLMEQYGLRFIPLQVIIGEAAYKDLVEIDVPRLFQSVEELGILPKTSAPSVADFTAFFDASPAEDLIFIGIGSKLSATYQSAVLAAETSRKNVHVIDSANLSTGIGTLVLNACEMKNQGSSAGEIVSRIEAEKDKVRCYFVIDTMDYLYKGGRCTAMQALVGSILKIRPVIEVRPDGTLGVKDKVSGSRKKAQQRLLEMIKKDREQLDLRRAFITHTCSQEEAESVKAELLKIAPFEAVHITNAGAVIASHCGPDTLGLIYALK